MTVAQAIRELMPHESLIYFGDTAHMPYGDKSRESVRHYAEVITDFLQKQGVKAIVIACNTASAHAASAVSEALAPVPVINVIDPVVEVVAKRAGSGKVGVIGTKGTIRSRVYVKRLHKANPRISVVSHSTPLLAPMIEEGFFNNSISRTIIHSYLSKSTFRNIESLILGCTHYPLIRPEVEEFYKGKVEVIDSASVVAEAVKANLEKAGLMAETRCKATYQFYVSDKTTSFEKSTRLFFGEKMALKENRIWD